ncbi:ankyrin repeat protein (macronuclear) [Tetrahymena thermophila SB210]|uniref:Ankyrin repeat protein n=1 Tax=Tetrahymena thermophila (strain SB210) TaxID=312017 RepID=W7WYL6_TETTS|nr:ankyrin repeat protein [Tetrahymena thermophila SB210]EWS71980.1 ankyrin repeat protein [Tetrahymena thermophila SB210]|eukprot:XP_012655480.1 ankyrin repeat protein [Tetrahymena thermophila SB210]
MIQEENLIQLDQNMIISDFKLNTMLCCSQESISQSKTQNNGDISQQKQNDQILFNQTSLGQSILIKEDTQHEKNQMNNLISYKNMLVEVEDEQNQQGLQINLQKVLSENAKSTDNGSENDNQRESLIQDAHDNKQIEQTNNKKQGKKIHFNLENNQICKQNYMIKSNSLEFKYQTHNQELFICDHHNTFDNCYEIKQQSNSVNTSICQSPRNGDDSQQFNKEDSSFSDNGDNSYYQAQSSSKKSKFHSEFFNQEFSNSDNQFFSDNKDNIHNIQQPYLKQIKSQDNNYLGHKFDDQFEDKSKILEILLQKNGQNQEPLNRKQIQKLNKVNKAIVSIQRLAKTHPKKINSIFQLEDDLKSYRNRSMSKHSQSNQQKKKETNQVEDNELENETHKEQDHHSQKNYKQAFDEIRRKEKMSFLCERGSEEDIKCIKQLLETDPRKYLRDTKDPEHFLSSRNVKGLTPIYIACKNGNLEVVKFLIKSNCNYMVTSKIQKQLEETPFETALRWNHVEICKFMLEKCIFEDKYLISCLPLCQNQSMKTIIESKIKKKSTACNIF